MVWTDINSSDRKLSGSFTVNSDMFVHSSGSSGQVYISADTTTQPLTQTIVGTAATSISAGDLVTLTINGIPTTSFNNQAYQTLTSATSTGIKWTVDHNIDGKLIPFTVSKYKPLTKTQKKKLEAEQKRRQKKISREDKQLKLAHERSMKLLKRWLTKNEWDALINKGELEIPSKLHDDEIYIIKKAAYEKVLLKKSGKLVSQHCLITDKHYPDGDVLLNKILLLQTDEKAFLKIAVKTDYNSGRVYTDWGNAHAFHVNYSEPPQPAYQDPDNLPVPNGMTRSPLITTRN